MVGDAISGVKFCNLLLRYDGQASGAGIHKQGYCSSIKSILQLSP